MGQNIILVRQMEHLQAQLEEGDLFELMFLELAMEYLHTLFKLLSFQFKQLLDTYLMIDNLMNHHQLYYIFLGISICNIISVPFHLRKDRNLIISIVESNFDKIIH